MNANYKTLISAVALFLALSVSISAAPGDLDPTFSGDGKLTDWTGRATSVMIQPDGKLVVAGEWGFDYALARYNSDGSIDTTFGNGTGRIIAGSAGAFAPDISVTIQPDGKIVVSGIAYYGDMWHIGLDVLRYNSDGSPDTAFGDNGRVNFSSATGGDWSDASWVHIQPDGKIIAGAGDLIFRLNPNGSPDAAFGGGDGIANVPLYAYASAILPNGKIVIAGPRWNGSVSNSTHNLVVARLDPDGTLDSTFGSGDVVTIPMSLGISREIVARTVAIQTDGKILAGGYRLVRFNENGLLDTGFGNNGIVTPPVESFREVVIQSDGKLVITGNSNSDFAIARFHSNGSLDTTFGGGDGVSTVDFNNSNDIAFGMALDSQRRAVIVGVSNNGSGYQFALARFLLVPPSTPFDFDGDGKADVSVFRPSDRTWYLNQSANGFSATQFGLSTDRITPADFDGDGKTDLAVYRDGTWYWLKSSDNSFNERQFGSASDIPVPADYSGDGRAELAFYRKGTWWMLNLLNDQVTTIQFELALDIPLPADYDGDGRADQAFYRNGEWHLNRSTQGYGVVYWGLAKDKPVPADYDGDGKTDLAVYRNGTWFIRQSAQEGWAAFNWGISSDLPAPADYDGDGRTDAAVFRNGTWYLRQSTGGISIQQFGLTNDKLVPAAYLP